MSDRELLEAAAKAAGLPVRLVLVNGDLDIGADRPRWNPLTDDGDALRLAVKLGIDLHLLPNISQAVLAKKVTTEVVYAFADPCAATRRAIVRAAAALAAPVAPMAEPR